MRFKNELTDLLSQRWLSSICSSNGVDLYITDYLSFAVSQMGFWENTYVPLSYFHQGELYIQGLYVFLIISVHINSNAHIDCMKGISFAFTK